MGNAFKNKYHSRLPRLRFYESNNKQNNMIVNLFKSRLELRCHACKKRNVKISIMMIGTLSKDLIQKYTSCLIFILKNGQCRFLSKFSVIARDWSSRSFLSAPMYCKTSTKHTYIVLADFNSH